MVKKIKSKPQKRGLFFWLVLKIVLSLNPKINHMTESIKFAQWILTHTTEVTLTIVPCRRYKGKVYTVSELYPLYLNWTAGL